MLSSSIFTRVSFYLAQSGVLTFPETPFDLVQLRGKNSQHPMALNYCGFFNR